MTFDSHLHTTFSPDSSMTIDEAIQTAKDLNLGIVTTEHLDLNMNPKWVLDVKDYIGTYDEHRKKLKDKFFIGIELGMDPRFEMENKSFICNHEFDFILGSVHTILDDDIYPKENYEKYTRDEFYRKYFRYVSECLTTHTFIHSFAHIDYPARYSPYTEQGFKFNEFSEEMSEIFKILARNNQALELNLRRFNRENLDDFLSIYKAFKDLGGKYVTIGSDAHRKTQIGYNIKDAVEFIKSVGLKNVHFKKMDIVIDSK